MMLPAKLCKKYLGDDGPMLETLYVAEAFQMERIRFRRQSLFLLQCSSNDFWSQNFDARWQIRITHRILLQLYRAGKRGRLGYANTFVTGILSKSSWTCCPFILSASTSPGSHLTAVISGANSRKHRSQPSKLRETLRHSYTLQDFGWLHFMVTGS